MNQPTHQSWRVQGGQEHLSPSTTALPHETRASMRQKIGIIDTSPTVRAIVRTSLGRLGYEVIECVDGREALRWLRTTQEPLPALLVLEITLPGLDGYTIARFLKHHPSFAAIPIVILTGRDGVLDRLKGRLVGADAYLTKPFRTQALATLVQALVRQPSSVVEAEQLAGVR
jgi:twitching motility two-component system response regulator PilG